MAAQLYSSGARQALKAFGFQGSQITLVAVAENITFRVSSPGDGESFVLRLHRPGYHTLEELNAERVWTAALRGSGIAVPGGLTTPCGEAYVPIRITGADEHRYAGMLTWTTGEVLRDVIERTNNAQTTDRYFLQLGSICASMHNQASSWRAPAGFSRHNLGGEGMMGEAPFWGRFWDHQGLSADERQLFQHTRKQLFAALGRYGQSGTNFSLIHADLHPGNVLVDGQRLTVIDFDDAGFGWHVYDIAVALKAHQSAPRFPEIQAAFLAGYRRHRALTDQAEALIPMFLLVRALAEIGWLYQRPELTPWENFSAWKADICARCTAFVPVV